LYSQWHGLGADQDNQLKNRNYYKKLPKFGHNAAIFQLKDGSKELRKATDILFRGLCDISSVAATQRKFSET
jgi:hypothetical protein